MPKIPTVAVIGAAVALTIALAAVFVTRSLGSARSGPGWEVVESNLPVGKPTRITVRPIGADGRPIADARIGAVNSVRLDMGPDGMAAMTAPLRAVPAEAPGVLAFETDLSMAGRWALTVSATVDGHAAPVTETVIFTAIDPDEQKPAAATAAGARKILYYRNPMGLPDTSPVPKKDSMGMDYIPVYADEMSGPPGTVRVSLDKVQRAGVRTEAVERRALTRTVRAAGTVVSDESRISIVAPKFGGFVEELFVAKTGAEVRQGQPLARVWIESPEILQKQSDYLSALRGRSDRPSDPARAEHNLRLFGIPSQAIENLRKTGEPVRSIVLTAPAQGIVVEKPAVVGRRFAAGEMLYRIVDHSTVWVMTQVAERDLGAARVGQTARVAFNAFPDERFAGRIAFIYPELDKTTRTAPMRIELPNPDGRLHIGLYADVEIAVDAANGPVVAIPDSAVIDSGRRQVAFVAKGDGLFEPRDLALGRRGGGYVEVREGVAEGEKVVVAGNFLIDAESNLRAALTAFAPQPERP